VHLVAVEIGRFGGLLHCHPELDDVEEAMKGRIFLLALALAMIPSFAWHRVTNLPPAAYEARAELQGFQSALQKVTVRISSIAPGRRSDSDRPRSRQLSRR